MAEHPQVLAIGVMGEAPRMINNTIPGMPGTVVSLLLRLSQLAFSAIGVLIILLTVGIPYNFIFRCLFIVLIAEGAWSLILSVADLFVLVTARTQALRQYIFLTAIVFGDGLICILALIAACSSAGVEILMIFDRDMCKLHHCNIFIVAIIMALMSMYCAASLYINCLALTPPP